MERIEQYNQGGLKRRVKSEMIALALNVKPTAPNCYVMRYESWQGF